MRSLVPYLALLVTTHPLGVDATDDVVQRSVTSVVTWAPAWHLQQEDRCAMLSPHLLAAMVQVVNTAAPTHLHLVTQTQPEKCLLEALWEEDVGVVVMREAHWWRSLQHVSYLHVSQHLLLGNLHWITSILSKVKTLYTSGKINAMKTRWIWVSTDLLKTPPSLSGSSVATSGLRVASDTAAQTRSLSPDPATTTITRLGPDVSEVQQDEDKSKESSSPTRGPSEAASHTLQPETFTSALGVVSGVLVEGMKGVFVGEVEQLPRHFMTHDLRVSRPASPEPRPQHFPRRVLVAGVDAPGDGSWHLKLAAAWATGGLQVFRPLWPSPSFNLHQRLVRLTCHKKPTVFEYEAGVTRLAAAGGYVVRLLLLLQKKLNFTDVILPVQGFGSLLPNGSWNGMVGVLARRGADVAPLDFTPSTRRSEVVEFGAPYGTDGVVILCQAPGLVIKPFLLLNIFSLLVWACLVGVGVVAGVVVGGLVVVEGRLVGGETVGGSNDGVRSLTSVFKIFLYQSCRWWPGGVSSRMVSGMVMMVALVVGSVYSGSVTAFLAIPFRSVPVNSAEDLVERGITPVFRDTTTFYNFIIAQEDGVLGEIRARMKAVEAHVLTSWHFLSKVADGTYALLDTYTSAMGRAQRYEKRGERCKFHVARHMVRMDFDTFAFTRNSFVMHQFNEIMRRLRHGGVITHLQQQYYNLPCERVLRRTGPEPMSLTQVQGAFYVLGVGITLAAASLLMELVLRACMRATSVPISDVAPWGPSTPHLASESEG